MKTENPLCNLDITNQITTTLVFGLINMKISKQVVMHAEAFVANKKWLENFPCDHLFCYYAFLLTSVITDMRVNLELFVLY